MSPVGIAAIVFACVFGAALLGLLAGATLPKHHLSSESKDVVKLATALIATMAALALSLLVSTAKGSFDRMYAELVENSARVVSLDRVLADYGPETAPVRALLKRSYAAGLHHLFPDDPSRVAHEDTPKAVVRMEGLRAEIWKLSPQTDAQRGLQSLGVKIASEIEATRWLLLLQEEEPIPLTLLVVLVCWLAVIFSAFGLFAPRNATVVTALFLCALSVSGAVLLVLEMDDPFSGLMKISSAPMREALAILGH